tara:strand:- start:1150 stop:1671 length:522 start_codon:yes stop_codon:yes gene_type:complete
MFVISGEMVKAQYFEKGTKVIEAGVQLQSEYVPFVVNFEAGVTDQIGIGLKGFVGSMKGNSFDKYNLSALQLVGTYHLNDQISLPMENLDVYGGIGIGILNIKTTIDLFGATYSESDKGFLITPHFGARYYFSDNIGINARVGMDIYKIQLYDTILYKTMKKPNLAIGVTFRF